MYIGGGTSVDEFKGILDDIRVYNRVLTADEIKRLYKIGATVKINTTLDGPQSGLVGHWTFDGPALALGRAPDESGSGNEGRLTNGPVRKEGKIGQALQFDGVDDYVEVASNAIYDSTQLAVSLWVKVRAAPPTDNYDVIMTRMDSTVRNGFNLTVDSDAEGGVAEFITMNGTGVVSDVYGSKKITDNAWHHIVMVLTQAQNGTNRLYVDGVLDATDQNTAAWAFNNQVIRIGNELDNANYTPFDGRMDDVRIYNRELTLDEIKRLYKSGSTVKINTTISTDSLTKGLVGHWTFDGKDMAGNHAYDASGNGNRGVLTNGPVRAAGKLGQGLSFDGVNDYVDIQDPANGSLDFGANQDFTYALWVRSTLQPIANKWPVFMNKGDLAGGGARTEIDIALHDSTDDARWFFGIFVNGTGYPNAYGNNDVADGKWHFLVGMRKGSNLITYEDGKPANIVAASSGSLATGDNQRIGQPTDISSCCNGFKGDIDDVRIYNRALTVDEIKRLYNLAGDTRIATGGSGGGGGSCTADCTIWSPSTVPSNPSENDPSAVELGVKFQSSVAGTVTGIRFYKGGTSNGGTHTGNLWNTGGTNLGTVTFSGESASGWQQADFGTPISISANTTYIASYHAPQGNYAGDGNGLASTVTNAPLSALSSASSGGNGVYVYSASSAFPTETFNASNYYVDVVFDPS